MGNKKLSFYHDSRQATKSLIVLHRVRSPTLSELDKAVGRLADNARTILHIVVLQISSHSLFRLAA